MVWRRTQTFLFWSIIILLVTVYDDNRLCFVYWCNVLVKECSYYQNWKNCWSHSEYERKIWETWDQVRQLSTHYERFCFHAHTNSIKSHQFSNSCTFCKSCQFQWWYYCFISMHHKTIVRIKCKGKIPLFWWWSKNDIWIY